MTPLWIFLVLLTKIIQVQCAEVTNTSDIIQDSGIVRAQVGTNVTLRCTCHSDRVSYFYWYQQRTGDNPQLILTRMKRQTKAEMSPGYKDRFQSLSDDTGSNHLFITDLRLSDSALYFCGILDFNIIQFGQGAHLHVTAPPTSVHVNVSQPASQPLQPGDALNLSCVANTDCGDGQTRLFWVKREVSEVVSMYPGAVHCTGGSCTSNLAMPSASSSDAGTYHCALASCGRIVFGRGTRVEMSDASTSSDRLLLGCLSVALAISTNVLLALAFITYRVRKKLCSVCLGVGSELDCPEATNEDADGLHYAALSLKRNSQPQRPGANMESECVYSRVTHH